MRTDTFDDEIELSLDNYTGKWGWFVALGVGLLVAGVVAGANLFLASLATALYIGAMMLVGGIMQVVHAFTIAGWSRRLLHFLSGVFYAAAGAVIVYDPALAAVDFALILGLLLVAAGIVRVFSSIQYRHDEGWGWIVVSGLLTMTVGIFIILAWPLIGLGLLGAILTVDLLFQGGGFIGLGLSLRSHRDQSQPSGGQSAHLKAAGAKA